MDNKTIRLLYLLDSQIEQCVDCPLYQHGRIKPYWTDTASYVLIGDVESNILLWEIMNKQGFAKEQFLIIQELNCKTTNNLELPYMNVCKKWVDLYINAVSPLRGMRFGRYLNENDSIEIRRINNFNMPIIPIVKSITPKFASYSKEGTQLLEQAVVKFKLM